LQDAPGGVGPRLDPITVPIPKFTAYQVNNDDPNHDRQIYRNDPTPYSFGQIHPNYENMPNYLNSSQYLNENQPYSINHPKYNMNGDLITWPNINEHTMAANYDPNSYKPNYYYGDTRASNDESYVSYRGAVDEK
jgi:hypothetical protein